MNQLLERGVEEIIEKEHLRARLDRGDKLRIKLGIDPTAQDLHLGHTVVLRKLRQFQDAGHQAVFIIGDFTATIGDPSGRNESRPALSEKDIKDNMKNYLNEAGKVIDLKKAEIHHNSEWYKKKDTGFLMELASKFTVARMMERDDFQKRLKDGQDISLLEILYPILQGYDSFAVKADLELGGTDQKFNLLTGRKVQKRYGQAEQDVMTMVLIEGLDGSKKMSKSLGNYIGLSERPEDMFGKTMSLPDVLMPKYFSVLTDVPDEEIDRLKKDLNSQNSSGQSLKGWKERLAYELVKIYHGEREAKKVRDEFNRVFSKREIPEDVKEWKTGGDSGIVDILVDSDSVKSKTEAKRLIDQKALSINGHTITDWDFKVKKGQVVKIGPRKFLKVL
ncbi:MAG: tyrosine--tRNA ligase [Candidatus Yanofskybacteria bacterium RIFCSPHIGHO2_02_FULL_44_12b]|uniref:Tyrosine--tRNA ligase n=2 Tax=Candidatus Yanofskyibacteriota TaxID=1752733 RepID=A0A1F8GJ65_9BACT|nr:MAG: Tyrosine-tRNA ligase [Candidatus Yanofskybacteria bacterium GW2011_GWA2_44_9]OGN05444.1 MAG: tyrosine--tRNA ligase [Candidatus Yanofskybacteria bacterium RIFCSPHIGHO2_01_FULL_44_24]OGN15450.1 MAG: tyrosine--tRNA ligase [Candidatus Yanofskybacteria bacterium RIFCSPHIGHO2_02_FULL_44_12b]OGN25434.1 MAG: tyrosine--tRNA ligase [Candidatus Yanofskybacteria bacterium RIFCSPLOWO2_01_FULL_44_22]